MICRYLQDDNAIFCNASSFPHVPCVAEMERLCFKDFRLCPSYNELRDDRPALAIGDLISKEAPCFLLSFLCIREAAVMGLFG